MRRKVKISPIFLPCIFYKLFFLRVRIALNFKMYKYEVYKYGEPTCRALNNPFVELIWLWITILKIQALNDIMVISQIYLREFFFGNRKFILKKIRLYDSSQTWTSIEAQNMIQNPSKRLGRGLNWSPNTHFSLFSNPNMGPIPSLSRFACKMRF